jgi:nicotinamidase-related amidase
VHDALLLLDVFDDFEHDDGEVPESVVSRPAAGAARPHRARPDHTDTGGLRKRSARPLARDVQRLLADLGADAAAPAAAPARQPEDAFFFKVHHSAFRHTALGVLLGDL